MRGSFVQIRVGLHAVSNARVFIQEHGVLKKLIMDFTSFVWILADESSMGF
jgi:hypothetical protein